MNWTGGGLSRSRNAKGSLSAKQKDYFAKARIKMQNGKIPRPETQTFDLGGWKPVIKVASSPRSVVSNQPSQKTLDSFEKFQPTVKRLDSLKPRKASNKRKRTASQSYSSHAVQAKGEAPDPIVIGSSQSSSSASSTRPREPRPVPDVSSSEGITDIEAKRRQLLKMTDWVGIDRRPTKPVKMRFADPRDRDLIGRRRKDIKSE